ncbi:MAG: lyase family protein, partial [Planctomycetia bacterium]|nr:lyase family protein [Planctomycetia bacterium]
SRSRNDQVLVDLRLWTKERLFDIEDAALGLAKALLEFAKKHAATPMPGRTHMQIAMPSSVGLWAGAHLEAILDDLLLLKAAYELNDQCPLGAAASYGCALPVDRQMTSDLLGFAKVQNNVLYANNSRGKIEAAVIAALAQIMVTLSKAAMDLIIFSMPEFGYFSIPAELCTGSSLMPQKKNPAGLELIRAKSATVNALLNQVLGIVRALPSGYNRDFQETKRPLMQAVDITLASLGIMKISIERLGVNKENLLKGFVPEIFATDRVLELVAEGTAFRDAYQQVAKDLDSLGARDPVENIKSKTHLGATGNLGLDLAEKRIAEAAARLKGLREAFDGCIRRLLA